jgi:hypothetical protein
MGGNVRVPRRCKGVPPAKQSSCLPAGSHKCASAAHTTKRGICSGNGRDTHRTQTTSHNKSVVTQMPQSHNLWATKQKKRGLRLFLRNKVLLRAPEPQQVRRRHGWFIPHQLWCALGLLWPRDWNSNDAYSATSVLSHKNATFGTRQGREGGGGGAGAVLRVTRVLPRHGILLFILFLLLLLLLFLVGSLLPVLLLLLPGLCRAPETMSAVGTPPLVTGQQ